MVNTLCNVKFGFSGHFCENEKYVPEYRKDSCGNYIEFILDGYELDKVNSSLSHLENAVIQRRIRDWSNNPSRAPYCTFVR